MGTSEKPARTRRGNMEGSTPRQRKDGRWQVNYPVGQRPDGSTILESVYGRTKSECRAKVRKLSTEVAAGNFVSGQSPKLIEWLDYWLAEIAPRTAKSPQSRATYANKINSHIRPHRISAKRMDKLTPSDFETVYSSMREPLKSKDGHHSCCALRVQHCRPTPGPPASTECFGKRGLLAKNPLLTLDAPTPEAFEPQVYSTDEVRRMIAAAQERDDEARWLLNLMLGPRQGEALGLTWPDIDFKTGKIRIERELFVLPWKHGCEVDQTGKASCGRRYGSNCSERVGGGYFTGPPKSSAGVRSVIMPAPLREPL
ncbi:hypothetical protein ACT3UD_17040 [Glutamicibacter sp. 287]|uniref:hypothetical protein n=1 Tax=unclassified Glutamicibacter TaxID=2627139 RepID=UPI0040335872